MSCLYVCRLYAKLSEDEEAAKLYNRFVAQAETSDVSLQSLTQFAGQHYLP